MTEKKHKNSLSLVHSIKEELKNDKLALISTFFLVAVFLIVYIYSMFLQERKKKCLELFSLCNLPASYYARLPSELSGGEQKRVAIARALAAEPKCLIFDEATNGFDLPLRKKIIEEIIVLQKQLGFTLIFITHDMELAVVIADEILVMKESVLMEQVAFTGDTTVFSNEYSKILLRASGLL